MKDPQVQNLVRAALDRLGVDDEFLALGLKEGLRADETKLATFEGKFTDERRVPDYRARARFQDMAHQLRGDYPHDPENEGQAMIVLKIPMVQMVPGHRYDCACNLCREAYAHWTREQVQLAEPTE